MSKIINTSEKKFGTRFDQFLNAQREVVENVDSVVAEILLNIKTRGNDALLEYTKKFDRVQVDAASMQFSEDESADAKRKCNEDALSALTFASDLSFLN